MEASGLSEDEVRQIIADNTKGKTLGVFGEETVNVLGVNLDIALAMGLGGRDLQVITGPGCLLGQRTLVCSFILRKRWKSGMSRRSLLRTRPPAWLMICLAESIKDWIGQSPRIFCKVRSRTLQFGYEVLTFPVAEFAQIFGPLIYAINQAWPVQVFGMGSQDELVELSFTKEGTAPTIQQKNVSGIPCAELRDLYFCVKFPDPLAADCMFRLLDAVEKKVCCRGPGVGVRRFSGTAAAGKN